MKDKRKKRITFLFGAGADLGLINGTDFKRDMILSKGAKELQPLFPHPINFNNGALITRSNSSVLKQTLFESKDDKGFINRVFKNESDREIANGILKREQVAEDLYKRLYEAIDKKDSNDFDYEYFLKKIKVYSAIDSHFNYLRLPEVYEKESKIIMRMYYSALHIILKSMQGYISEETDLNHLMEYTFKAIGENDPGFGERYCNYIDELENAVIKVFKNKNNNEKNKHSYYDLIQEKCRDLDFTVITTNYTGIAQKYFCKSDEDFAYLHGRLTFFEDVNTKRIARISELDTSQEIFPYLLVQSGVKPIISPYQIGEFAKMKEWLESESPLFVVGYGINSDDDHINTFIRERVVARKKTIIFYHDDFAKQQAKRAFKGFLDEQSLISDKRFGKELEKYMRQGC